MKNNTNMKKWLLMNDTISQSDKESLIEFLRTPNVRFTNSQKVREFESDWSSWLGTRFGTFVNSGASANYISAGIIRHLMGCGEIIIPPVGWVSDVVGPINHGFTPVFVDVDLETYALNVEQVKKAITKDTKAIFLVHPLGMNGLTDELLNVVDENNLILVEDCCESHGATHNFIKVGTFGHISNFSFYFGHHMTTIEGGMISTNDSDIYEASRMFRSHGMVRECSPDIVHEYRSKYPDLSPDFIFGVAALNMRNTEMNAVLGIEQLKRLDDGILKRTKNFKTFLDNLDEKEFFTDFKFSGSSNYALPLMLRPDNTANKLKLRHICNFLDGNNIEYRIGGPGGGNQARQPYLKSYPHRVEGDLKNTDHIHRWSMYIGNHSGINTSDVAWLCDSLNEVTKL